ncbi:MAG TPA: hypothetical protein VIC33_08140 [Vicinamibacterales bacterium]|jgi:hypothetical protein
MNLEPIVIGPVRAPRSIPGPRVAAFVYFLLALVLTWPLAPGIARDLPGDLGHAMTECWAIGWDLHHLIGFFGGQVHALAGYWQANIFYPAPIALAYGEHLTGQALQALPVYLASGNLVLCYNLLVLSTFVLCGLGAYLFVREATGRSWPALLAGLLYAFAPYRFTQLAHVEMLSAQWLPFALYALLRYFRARRGGALAGAVAAIVLQNLSCTAYLVFLLPILAFVVAQIAWRDLWRDGRMWSDLAIAGLVVTIATLPVVWPYLHVQARGLVEGRGTSLLLDPRSYRMVAVLALALVAGYGAAAIDRLRFGAAGIAVIGLIILVQAGTMPIALDGQSADFNSHLVRVPQGPVPSPALFPLVYRFVAELPPAAPIVELPFGEPALERYYMYFSTAHWHPLLNGDGDLRPPAYLKHRAALRDILANPDKAWAMLTISGTRYVVLHEAYYRDGRGAAVEAWLLAHDARQLATFGTDAVYALPAPQEPRAARVISFPACRWIS